ncbi:MAG: hypothetical protein ACE15E_21540 [Acidobacteriota bacterium]
MKVELPRINPTVKLALLLALFALFNLAPKKEDCCKTEEEGDDPPRLFRICAWGDPEIEKLDLDAGATTTFYFKQDDCGDANSTFLVPRPWNVRPGTGMTILSQTPTGSRLAVTVKVTEHPEVYENISFGRQGILTSCLIVTPQASGMASLVKGELEVCSASQCVGIRQAPGVDVPWSRSNAQDAPRGPRIEAKGSYSFVYLSGDRKSDENYCTIYNRGAENLVIHSIVLEEPGPQWFALKPGQPQPPFYVAPGEYTDVWTVFTPTSTGAKGATLVVTTNDPKFPVVRISMKGNAYQ